MEEYFAYLDNAGVNRNYDWFSLNININYNKEQLNIEKIINKEIEFGNSEAEIIFIHEYIHYLQNFNTPLGAVLLCQFVHALYQLGASKVEEEIVFELPMKLKTIPDKTLWNKGIDGINQIKQALGESDDKFSFANPSTFEKYEVVKADDLTISNGRIVFEVTNKTVREHMAHIGSMLFSGYTDEQIHADYISRPEFCVTVGMLEKQPSYWILFEYFYFNKYTNVAEGLIFLCAESLTCEVPMTVIEQFFKSVTDPKFINMKDLRAFVGLWVSSSFETNSSFETKRKKEFFDASLKMVTEKIKLCKKHAETHDFYKFNVVLFEKLYSNLLRFEQLSRYFFDAKTLRDKNTWVKIIAQFGTPIMRCKDKKPIITGQSDRLVETLTYFLGVVKTIESLTNTTTDRCPFHTDFAICLAGHKNDTTCLTNPAIVKNPKEHDGECIYQNSIVLMGFDGRLNIEAP